MWKNNPNFVKDEPMIYVDCIIIAVMFLGGGGGSVEFRLFAIDKKAKKIN